MQSLVKPKEHLAIMEEKKLNTKYSVIALLLKYVHVKTKTRS